jgi:hypothetical protein
MYLVKDTFVCTRDMVNIMLMPEGSGRLERDTIKWEPVNRNTSRDYKEIKSMM